MQASCTMRLIFFAALFSGILLADLAAADDTIDFNRQIRPILSNNCFPCHGPNEADRQADLRLDDRDVAVTDMEVITPGAPDDSTLIDRITSEDEDERMSPADSGKSLTAEQIELLTKWIAEGAKYKKHWAYVPPQTSSTPIADQADWPCNWIDKFILARLESEGLKPSEDADRVTLIRRLSLDLTGIPPTSEEVDTFIHDTSDDAYEQLVDRLLASPHFGERMAMWWFDLVRFADTVGYHGDQTQNIWPFRDYVISAFNANMSFDQFTKEQLAGDLLDKPTRDQQIATGYNRLLQTTHEGGFQLKEYRAIYMADRVRNVSQVWMGATMGCAQCHDHKYDPYTTREFYSMGAFFADVDDEAHLRSDPDQVLDELPTVRIPELALYTTEQRCRLDEIAPGIDAVEPKLKKLRKEIDGHNDKLKAIDVQIKAIDEKLAKCAAEPQSNGLSETADQTKVRADLVKQQDLLTTEHCDATAKRNALQQQRDTAQSQHDQLAKPVAPLIEERDEIQKSVPKSMITQTLDEPRVVHILPRGNWLDESGPTVEPRVPEFLGKAIAAGRRANRLDLAQWLVTPASQEGIGELSARVQVNRFWYLLMGTGIARTLDDFGGQGDPPVHPELLDRLAIEFIRSDWDVKHMMKLIAMSHTYRQSSVTTAHRHAIDPDNRLYACQSRWRLPAEMIRDNALAISGLLVPDIGGPSVKPYQPAGYYQHLNFPVRKYQHDKNAKQWRRGVYVHWQRQFLHPLL